MTVAAVSYSPDVPRLPAMGLGSGSIGKLGCAWVGAWVSAWQVHGCMGAWLGDVVMMFPWLATEGLQDYIILLLSVGVFNFFVSGIDEILEIICEMGQKSHLVFAL